MVGSMKGGSRSMSLAEVLVASWMGASCSLVNLVGDAGSSSGPTSKARPASRAELRAPKPSDRPRARPARAHQTNNPSLPHVLPVPCRAVPHTCAPRTSWTTEQCLAWSTLRGAACSLARARRRVARRGAAPAPQATGLLHAPPAQAGQTRPARHGDQI